MTDTNLKPSGEKLDFVRTDQPVPVGPNPYDNGTAEPAPEFGDPNGTPLEEVVASAHPSAYDLTIAPLPDLGHPVDDRVDQQARPVTQIAPVLTNADVQRLRGQTVTVDGTSVEDGGTPVHDSPADPATFESAETGVES